MVLFYVIGAVVLIALGVTGLLLYLLNKESAKENDAKAVPVTSLKDTMLPAVPSQLEEEYKKKAADLEEELKVISEKSIVQGKEALAMIDTLTKENQELRSEQEKINDERLQLKEAEKQVDQMRQDGYMLQTQLDTAHGKVEQLQQEAIVVRQRMEDDLAKAHTTIEQITSEREAIAANRESSTQATQVLSRERDDLKTQNETLLQENVELRSAHQQLKELNNSLTEKAQGLEYELTKNRAQSSGLERICENYRLQLEKKI